jgi:hypothetical protein
MNRYTVCLYGFIAALLLMPSAAQAEELTVDQIVRAPTGARGSP